MGILIEKDLEAVPDTLTVPGSTELRHELRSSRASEVAQVEYALDPDHDIYFLEGGQYTKTIPAEAVTVTHAPTPVRRSVTLACQTPPSSIVSVEIVETMSDESGDHEHSMCTVLVR